MPLPGDPDALLAAAEDLQRAATGMTGARDAIAAHGRSTTARWDGVAAGRALATIHQHATSTGRAADAATGAVAPLRTYAEELRRAQQDHLLGEQMVRDGQTTLAGIGSGATTGADAAREAAHQTVTDGANTMLAAEERALAANQAAARAVAAATTQLDGIAPPPNLGLVVGRGGGPSAGAIAAEIGNAAASLGNAALNNPLDVGAMALGGALATVSAVGVAGSAAATATGPGAVIGLPLGGLSAAGVVAGAGIAGAGAIDLALHAATDDRVAPFQVNEATGRSTEDRVREIGVPGNSRRVRQVATEEEVRAAYDELAEEGEPIQGSTYPGPRVRTPDGSEVGIREESDSGGATVDVTLPNGVRWKIHIPR